jgi:hypothetical protein
LNEYVFLELSIECPFCQAAVGQDCRYDKDKGSTYRAIHTERTRAVTEEALRSGARGANDKPREFHVYCGECAHEWVAFYMPIQLSLVSRFKDVCCPKCASPKVFVGNAPLKVKR